MDDHEITATDAATLLPQVAARLGLPRATLTGWVGTCPRPARSRRNGPT
ncbi:hypothetical protein OKJ48_29425 [Streptomyces kunmingensis]|uniref:Uncharacterized protein n=1 Tax=Streptomyces kunmingensis TaxID=68225 RepID=A0ABU6CHZ8_9ACTN|nr:hypothetical protein [Streptomyces kunmingensis]MEB3964323.1 hypothetical protein [Streptomyces kunmingensis]